MMQRSATVLLPGPNAHHVPLFFLLAAATRFTRRHTAVQAQFLDIDVGSCQICQNGQSVPDPTLKPDEAGGSSCSALETEASNNPYYPCPVYHYFGALCGCADQVPPTDACSLCQEGTGGTVTTPGAIADDDTGQTCASIAFEASYISENTLGYSCSYYHMLGNKCGCTNVPNTEQSCGTLCDDGTTVPNPTGLAVDGRQCSVVEAEALFNPYELTCDPGQQSYDGLLCGCDNAPPANACGPLCGGGPNSTSASADLPNPDLVVLNYASCSELNDISTWDTVSECDIYDLYASLCGCENVEPPATSCGPLCQDGSDVVDPDLIVQEQPCFEYEIMGVFETQLDNCPYYDMIGALCGCNNVPPADSCGKLCGADQELPDPDILVWGQTCREWEAESVYDIYSGEFCEETYREVQYLCKCPDVELPDDGCGTLCLDGSDVPFPDRVVYNETCSYWAIESLFDAFGVDEGYCGDYFHIGDLCGCANEPPEDGCQICDGPLAFPDKISYDLDGEVFTCQEDAEYVPFAFEKEDKECLAMRSVVAPYCGCESSPPKDCSICPAGKNIRGPEVNAPNFTYTDSIMGETEVSNENCLDVEFIVNLGAEGIIEDECAEISAQVASECCIDVATSGGSRSISVLPARVWGAGMAILALFYSVTC